MNALAESAGTALAAQRIRWSAADLLRVAVLLLTLGTLAGVAS